jgi:hypothetical protein
MCVADCWITLENTIPGRALSDCEIVRSDKSPMTVQWKNQSDISDLTGTTIRLQVEMINGDLFSLQFQNVSHRSNGSMREPRAMKSDQY